MRTMTVLFSLYFIVMIYAIPVGIYMFQFNIGNTRTRCEICSKVTIKTLERRH